MKTIRLCLILLIFCLLSGCASTNPSVKLDDQTWLTEIRDYETALLASDADRLENMFLIDENMRQTVKSKFTARNRHTRARELARWLISSEGHDMEYDIEANLPPVAAYYEKRGNCLSFTILLIALAKEVGVELKFNDVDLPSMWDMDEQQSYVFYRHINATFKTASHSQVFDLAMEEYDPAYPQRVISDREAGALLHSNLGIKELRNGDMSQAFHHLKLAASIAPNNADIWVNLGAAFKRNGEYSKAERSFKIALGLNDKKSLAASNLERLYRLQNRMSLAETYMKKANRARLKNPYVQYQKAKIAYDKGELRNASKAIKRAIRLHDLDPKFYELSSFINQRRQNYSQALLDLEKAFNLSKDVDERGRYFNKVQLVAKRAEEFYKAKQERQRVLRSDPNMVDYPQLRF